MPILELIVALSPLTVPRAFADRSLSHSTAAWCPGNIGRLFPGEPTTQRPPVEARARGMVTSGARLGIPEMADLVVDAGGVVATRTYRRRKDGVLVLEQFGEDELHRAIALNCDALLELGAVGRAVAHLYIRGAEGLAIQFGDHGTLPTDELGISGEVAIPATDEDVAELTDRWTRELARAGGIHQWEPAAASQERTA